LAIAYIITGVLPAPLIPYGGFVVVFMDCKYCIAFILKNGNTPSFTKVSYLSVASLDTVDSSSSLASPSDQECGVLGYNSVDLLCSSCDALVQFRLGHHSEDCKKCCKQDGDAGLQSQSKYPRAILEVCG